MRNGALFRFWHRHARLFERGAQKEQREDQREDLRDWERKPDAAQHAGQRQQVGSRDEHHDLARDGDEHAVDAVAKRLTRRAGHDADAGKHERQAHDAQRGRTNLEHCVRGVKHQQQLLRDELEHEQTNHHDRNGVDHAEADRLVDTLRLLRTVVIGNDRHHAVIQTEHRHEHKALELEVNAEHGNRRGGIRDEDHVHDKARQRRDAAHDDRRDADGRDLPHKTSVRADVPQAQMHLRIFEVVERHGDDRAQALADHRRPGRAGNAHLREAEQAEDEDRVEDDVRDRTDQLRDHGIDRATGRLQETLEGDLDENAERAQNADVQVRDAVIDDRLNIRLRAHVSTDADQAGDEHEQIAQQRQQQAVDRDLIDALGVFLPQRTREQRIDADAEADSDGNDDVLQRERHGHRRERILADARDKDTVHDVVQRLHEHGDHHRHCHRQQQPIFGHRAHFIFAKGFLRHSVTPIISTNKQKRHEWIL